MSNRNRRIKPIEVNLRKEITNLEDEVLNLHEENSQLRNLIDQQNDYIKQGFNKIEKAIIKQHQKQGKLGQELENEKKLRRCRDSQLRAGIAEVGIKIRLASYTWLGKFIFK